MAAIKRRTGFAWRFWLSIFLGFITAGVVEVIARNPRYDVLIEMTNAALMPANYVAHLVYPMGSHSGAGVANWGYVYYTADIVSFTLMWLIVITALYGTRSQMIRPH